MEISYSFEVVAVGPNSMDVSFSTPGGSTVLVGAALPPVGTSLSDHLIQYAPIMQWAEELTQRQVVEVGASGTTTLNTTPAP